MTTEKKLKEWTSENWQAYLDFCNKYSYVISNYTWSEYRHGRLMAQSKTTSLAR